jgi:hypothetical protein
VVFFAWCPARAEAGVINVSLSLLIDQVLKMVPLALVMDRVLKTVSLALVMDRVLKTVSGPGGRVVLLRESVRNFVFRPIIVLKEATYGTRAQEGT